MSVDFKVKQNGGEKILRTMNDERASFFAGLTNLAADFYSVPLVPVEIESGECWIDADSFCHLVEQAFFRPIDLLYSWSSIAAFMYEGIKGQLYEWEWEPSEAPAAVQNPKQLQPERQEHLKPTRVSGKRVVPYETNWMEHV